MTTNTQKPTIGRIVHYWVLNSEECHDTPNPAIITRVNPDSTCDLHVFGEVPIAKATNAIDPAGFRRRVEESTDGRAGTWCWPPRS